MAKYKLTYFDFKGLAEPIRFMLSYMGKEFEDNRLTFESWGPLKNKIPFGKLPTLEIDGKLVSQSAAICRYLAIEAGLNGKNDWENLEIDMIVGTYFDFATEVVVYFKQDDAKIKETLREKILKDSVPLYFDTYEERVKNDGYLANKSLSWADIFFAANVGSLEEILGENFLDKYINLKALKERIFDMPNIKKWVERND